MLGLPSKKELERISNISRNLQEEFAEIADQKELDRDVARAKLEGIWKHFCSDYEFRKGVYENLCDVLSAQSGTVLLVDLYPSNEKEPETEE